MQDVYDQLLKRNTLETTPFVAIHQSNASLLRQVDWLQEKCRQAQQEAALLRQKAASVALQTDLQQQFEKLKQTHQEAQAEHKQELSDLKAKHETHCQSIEEAHLATLQHWQDKVQNAESNADLAQQQYEGLKMTIRTLQEENDQLNKENRKLETKLETEHETLKQQMTILTEKVEQQRREILMLRSYKDLDSKPSSSSSKTSSVLSLFGLKSSTTKTAIGTTNNESTTATRPWGTAEITVPKTPRFKVLAHANKEGMMVRSQDHNLVATSGTDSCVKIWDVSTTAAVLQATLHGSPGHPILSCDIAEGLAVGAATDKTCRVWNVRTQRMLHHLVGHQNRVHCARLVSAEKLVVTASADRSIKVWDIGRTTYRQNITLRHSSTVTSLDHSQTTLVSGHMDGGLRFWDIRAGKRTHEFKELHGSGITSVQVNRAAEAQILTNSLDSSLQLIDVRNGQALTVFRHPDFVTNQSWSAGVFSPDGKWVAAGCNDTGVIFVWEAATGRLATSLDHHSDSGVGALHWSRDNGQLVSLDRSGNMIVWAH